MILFETQANEFFTINSVGSLTGATAIVVVITNSLYKAFGIKPRWLGLIISLLIMIIYVYLIDGGKIEYFTGVINAFLVYATAVGSSQIMGHSSKSVTPKSDGAPFMKKKDTIKDRKFFTDWW